MEDYFISPIRRTSNGSWIDQNKNEIINMDNIWNKGQPDGGDLQQCATFLETSGKFDDSSCSYKSCFICGWNREPLFTLRGLCSNSNLDNQYILRTDITYNENLFFYGMSNNNIVYSNSMKSWLIVEDKIEDLLKTGTFSVPSRIIGIFKLNKLGKHYLPVGTNFWNVTEPGCSNNMMPLKLTKVSTYIPFNPILHGLLNIR